jgi:hypothetical protein
MVRHNAHAGRCLVTAAAVVGKISGETTEPQSGDGWGYRCSPPDHAADPLLSLRRRCDSCEERAMADDDIRQPQAVSKDLANYLDMTTSRSRAPKRPPRRRKAPEPIMRPPIDNRGLGLEEGNDFA